MVRARELWDELDEQDFRRFDNWLRLHAADGWKAYEGGKWLPKFDVMIDDPDFKCWRSHEIVEQHAPSNMAAQIAELEAKLPPPDVRRRLVNESRAMMGKDPLPELDADGNEIPS